MPIGSWASTALAALICSRCLWCDEDNMVHFMGPRGEVQAVRGHLIVLEPGTSSPIHIAGGSSWDWSLSPPEVLCGSLLFLTLMWLRVFSTVCSGSAFSGVRCPLGLPCVWPRAPVLHGAVDKWKLAWLWVLMALLLQLCDPDVFWFGVCLPLSFS